MTTANNGDPADLMQRRDAALARLDEGHRTLMASLEGLDPEEAFLGSRWCVREVLLHLDAENYVDALEKIALGEQEMLPPFSTREEQLQKEIDHLKETHQRFRRLISGLTPEQLVRPATPPNPVNSFPGLSLLELIERSCGHEATHSRQIELTRQYVAAFRSRERAVSIIGLGDGNSHRLADDAKGLLNQADLVAGEPEALSAVRLMVRGVELTIRPENRAETVSRLAREARAGLWGVIVCMGSPEEDAGPLVELVRQHADAVAVY